ncbi:hypothetical protein [Effusibacillus consociatus]|uniref:Uncharacterized protein n=1 Tax=Effusibacillus consociatus TaxID=1117041 RepID=A0ABV9PWZ1_9BACL
MNRGIGVGQVISFRLPADTPIHVIEFLNHLKETEGRGFSKKIGQMFITGVNQELASRQPNVLIPLPQPLSTEQQHWLNHSVTQEFIGKLICQLASHSLPVVEPPVFEMPIEEVAPHKEKTGTGFQVSTPYHQKLVNFLFEE